MATIDYERLYELREKLQNHTATPEEEREYMDTLLKNNKITKRQYDDYFADKDKNTLLDLVLLVGGGLLAGWLISRLFNNK